MTDTSQQQAPLPRHAANMPSAASKSKQDEMVTLLSPSRQNEDFFFFTGLCVLMDFTMYSSTKAGNPSDISPIGVGCHQGSGGRETRWVTSSGARFACWCDAGPVFMQHHKYAYCFLLYGSVYGSEMAVFALSEVIYLSSSVTAENKAVDGDTSYPLDGTTFKSPGCLTASGEIKTSENYCMMWLW